MIVPLLPLAHIAAIFALRKKEKQNMENETTWSAFAAECTEELHVHSEAVRLEPGCEAIFTLDCGGTTTQGYVSEVVVHVSEATCPVSIEHVTAHVGVEPWRGMPVRIYSGTTALVQVRIPGDAVALTLSVSLRGKRRSKPRPGVVVRRVEQVTR